MIPAKDARMPKKPRTCTIVEYWDATRNMLQVYWVKKKGPTELLREVWYKEKPWVAFNPEQVTPDIRVTQAPKVNGITDG